VVAAGGGRHPAPPPSSTADGGGVAWAVPVGATNAVQVRRVGEVAEIVLARPGKLNAMNMA
jgi:hypothetical protein